MTRLAWNEVGERYFETGIDRGVLYLPDSTGDYSTGYAWNGIVSIDETPGGGEPKTYFIDGINHLNISAREVFNATLSAFYSPAEFDRCDGSVAISRGLIATQQRRTEFGLTYRTQIGNDTNGTDHGYKIHLVYHAMAKPSSKSHATISDDSDFDPLSWDIITRTIPTPNAAPAAHFIVDTTKALPEKVALLEDIIYGTVDEGARLPWITEIFNLFEDEGFVIDGGIVPSEQPGNYNAGGPLTVPDEFYQGGSP